MFSTRIRHSASALGRKAIRTAKPSSSWTRKDLDAYHITVNQVMDPLAFFGVNELPHPSVNQDLLHVADADATAPDHQLFLSYLDRFMNPPAWGYKHHVIDFTLELFRALGYYNSSNPTRFAYPWVNFPFRICGTIKRAKPDLHLLDDPPNTVLLLLQEDRTSELVNSRTPSKAQAQLIANAVAAFNRDNINRNAAGISPLDEKVMPGIVMKGTLPQFFKIPVTQNLSDHIFDGTYPAEETHVTFCSPSIRVDRRFEGMKPLDNRLECLKYFEAFKAIMNI